MEYSKKLSHTACILEKLLIADLDSHTLMQNKCQLEQLKEIIKIYERELLK